MNSFPSPNGMPDILGYGQRPSGFPGLMLALSRLGFPGGQMPYGVPGQMPYGAPGQMPYGAPGQMPYGAPGQMMPYGGAGGWDPMQMQNQYMAALQAQAMTQQMMQGQAGVGVGDPGLTYGQ